MSESLSSAFSTHRGRPVRSLSNPRGVLTFWLPAFWLVVVVLTAVIAPILPMETDPDYSSIASAPSTGHLLGTDSIGRDNLSRLILGGRSSLFVAFCAVLFGMSIGVGLGLTAGYFRGKVDLVISAVVDVVLAFPGLVLIMVLVAIRGASTTTIVVGLTVAVTPTFTRIARANTLSFAQRGFVTAARVQGARSTRILFREVLPNVLPTVQAYAFVVAAVAMVAQGSLSFIGLGVPPPTPSWGGMVAEGLPLLAPHPTVALIPAGILFLTVLSFNLVGDSLRTGSGK